MSLLIDPARAEIKMGDYRLAPATALSDPSLLPRVQDYRRGTSARMYPLDRTDIRQKIPKADYHVSRKVDGEFSVLIFSDGELCTLNPGGTVRLGLPFSAEAIELLQKAGIQQAMIAGELYVQKKDRRPRVHDVTSVARNPKDDKELAQLRFAVFDILSIDGAAPSNFAECWQIIERIFGKGKLIHPVESKSANNPVDIEAIFEQWVSKEGAEGLVVRSDTAGQFKIKPRNTIDATIIGFTESVDDRTGMLHDLLLAVMRSDGTFHVLCRVGGGFSEDQRRSMLTDLKDMIVPSEYAEVNSDHVAYQMVAPEWVVEISCLDLIAQTTRGGPIQRMVLEYGDKYTIVRRMPCVSVISPQFIRRREDKSSNPQDVRISQISDIVEVPLVDRDARQMTMPRSAVLLREVYTKVLKGETMVRKFVLWKTNKENESDEFPAYVLHYTDYSPNRKSPLSREVRVSSSEEQISAFFDQFREEYIKKGWEQHSTMTAEAPPAEAKTESPAKSGVEKKPKKSTKKTPKTEESAASESSPTPEKPARGKKKSAAPKEEAIPVESTTTVKKSNRKKTTEAADTAEPEAPAKKRASRKKTPEA